MMYIDRKRPNPFLSPTVLRELTGFVQKDKQIGWLRDHRWLFDVDRFGRPRVAQAYYDRRLVGIGEDTAPMPATAEKNGPDWGALRI